VLIGVFSGLFFGVPGSLGYPYVSQFFGLLPILSIACGIISLSKEYQSPRGNRSTLVLTLGWIGVAVPLALGLYFILGVFNFLIALSHGLG